jgi:hypothetical protein
MKRISRIRKLIKRKRDEFWTYTAQRIFDHSPPVILGVDVGYRQSYTIIVYRDKHGEMKVISDSTINDRSYKSMEEEIRRMVKYYHITNVARDYPRGEIR